MISLNEGISFEEMKKASKKWRHDIFAFCREAMRVPKLSWQQEASLTDWQKLLDVKLKMHLHPDWGLNDKEELMRYIVGQSIRSGKGPGKDAEATWKASHFQTCFPNSKIFCTSINQDHMKQVLWPEMISD